MVGRHPVLVQTLSLDVIFRDGNQLTGVGPRELPTHLEPPQQLMVDPHLDLVRVFGDPVNRFNRVVSLQPDGEHVVAVQWKRVTHSEPTMRGERHVFAHPDVSPLEPDLVHLGDRPVVGAPHRRPADLGGSRHVPRHQRRGDRQHIGVVVETEARHVAREQLLTVDLESEQILDGADILESIEPPRGHAARVWCLGRRPVERRLDRGDKALQHRRIRLWPALGWHLTASQLADDLLQHLGIAVNVRDVDGIERKPCGQPALVVTGDAVLVEQCPGGGTGAWGLGTRRGQAGVEDTCDDSQNTQR